MKTLQKTFTLQHDQSDCGVACLLSMIRYYGGEESLENLRILSGTDTQGTSLMGLYEAASKLGFTAKGCQMDIPTLVVQTKPVILHVLIEGRLQHYVVCYGVRFSNSHSNKASDLENRTPVFIIGDPAKGIVGYSAEELEAVWQSKRCLTLAPNESFVTVKTKAKEKRTWLLNLLQEDYPILLICSILGIIIAVLGMVMAIFSQKLIDDILPSQHIGNLMQGLVVVTLLLLVRVGLVSLRQFLLYRQSKDFNKRLGGIFYETLLRLPKSFFDTRKIGDFTARLNDSRRIQLVVSEFAGTILADLLTIFVSLGFLFYYSWQAGGLVCLSIPFYFYLVYRQNTQIIQAQKSVMSAYAYNESNYINTLQGIGVIKNHNKEDFFSQVNQFIYGNWQDKVFLLGKINTHLSLIVGIASVLFLAILLGFTSFQVYQNQLSIGEMMALVGVTSSLLPIVTKMALINIPFNEAKVAFDRMFEYINIEKEDGQATPEQIISIEKVELQGIFFRFAGRKPLLSDISLEIKRGEIISIIGESGSGKSTILQILERFYEVEKGEIIINGHIPLKNISLSHWRNFIGVVPQQIHIFNGTVLDNILLDSTSTPIEQLGIFLQEFGFVPFIQSLPQGLHTIIGESGVKLSGGQKQLLALARALYKKPQLLLLDEATAALDRKHEMFVLQILERIKPHTAIVFVSHKMQIVEQISDKIYCLENTNLYAMSQTYV